MNEEAIRKITEKIVEITKDLNAWETSVALYEARKRIMAEKGCRAAPHITNKNA